MEAALKGTLEFLLPPACAGCGGPQRLRGVGDNPGPVCLNCAVGLRPIPAPICDRCGAPAGGGAAPACLECAHWPHILMRARAVTALRPPASSLVHALKYQGWRGVGAFMGREMARLADPLFRTADAIVPVPTSPVRARRRGYNQAYVIAEGLAAALDIPLCDGLERPGSQSTQTTLAPADRRANVHNAFRLGSSTSPSLGGKTLILVDDVITTGATLSAAASALEAGRPSQVLAYAFARRIPLGH